MRQRNKKHSGKIQFDQIDIREVLDDLDIYYTETGKNVSEGWIGVSCPFCGDESNHLGINLNGKSISCFKCGETGTIIKYLAEELGSWGKAINILGDAVPREMKRFGKEIIKERSVSVELPKEASKKILKYHAQYLNKRGYSFKYLMKKYDFYFVGVNSEDWSNRIIVPVYRRKKLITFTSVSIMDDIKLRYKHLKDEKSVVSIKHYLYGLESVKGNSICVVEGLFDKFRIGDGCVCSFGTNLTAEQKILLTNYDKVVVCFDGDDTGKKSANKLANDISAFTDVEILDIPEGNDPDSLPKEDVMYIRNKIGM